jgi:hypothetical protein
MVVSLVLPRLRVGLLGLVAVGHSNPNRQGGSASTRHLPLGAVGCFSGASSLTRRVTRLVAIFCSGDGRIPQR